MMGRYLAAGLCTAVDLNTAKAHLELYWIRSQSGGTTSSTC